MCLIQVNLNGHISFETELPVYRSNFVLPFGYKLLAVFLADVDTRLSGNVYYRYAQGTNRGEFNKRLHGNIQYIQKQSHLLQFLN